MKTKLTLITLLLALATLASAQSISVASFRLLDTDMTANLQGTMRTDQNGHTAALIKVVTTQTGFTFEGGMMGIVDTQQKSGEVWVYVPYSSKKITITHPQLGVLRDYYFPIAIEEAKTYEMILSTGMVTTIVEEDAGGSYLMLTVEPENATVYIDDKMRSVIKGEVMLMLPYGKHSFRVEAASFMTQAGTFEIGKQRKEMKITLESAQAMLTISCTDNTAKIFLNEIEKGRGSWSGLIDAGMYVVEARKDGHRTEKQTVSLAEQEQKTITINAPKPIYGKLNLQSTPGNCEVYFDGIMIGKSPDIFSNLLVGIHEVELKREGYESETKQISIEEGKTVDINFILTERIQNLFESEPEDYIYPCVEEMPEYPGGDRELLSYINKSVVIPKEARRKGIEGRVFVNFTIEPDGSISNANILRGIGGGCDEEALRVVNGMEKWKPGKHRGKIVRVSQNIAVNFKLH